MQSTAPKLVPDAEPAVAPVAQAGTDTRPLTAAEARAALGALTWLRLSLPAWLRLSLPAWLRLSLPAWLRYPLLAFFSTRLIVLFTGFLAAIALPSPKGDGYWHPAPDNLWVDSWSRWDSGFYLGIVGDGYRFVPGEMSSVAFFPLYPLLVSLCKPLVGSAPLAGIVVSSVFLLGGLVALYLLAELWLDDAAAARSVYYIAAFPTALFFTAVYTESIFLCVSVATAYFARRRLWAWAALFGMLTSASRIVGVVIWGVVIHEWLQAQGWTLAGSVRRDVWARVWEGVRRDWRSLVVTAAIPLGIVSYMAFLAIQFGDPFAFWSTQAAWGRKSFDPIGVIWWDFSTVITQDFVGGKLWWQTFVNLLALGLVFGLAGPIARRFGASYTIYTLLGVLIPASSGTGSMTRYVVVLFPLFLMLAWYGRRPAVDKALLIGFSVLLGLFTAIYVNWYFLA